ncbi:MAG: arginine--tRNA ligase [Firmicutes bacterium]|nr:arginine--tRNA ligase [Bacillota bacterium]
MEIFMDRVKADIIGRLKAAVSEAVQQGNIPAGAESVEIGLERPARPEHGDLATNAAMLIASAVRSNPRKIAEAIAGSFSTAGSWVERVEIAGPGFINFHLGRRWVEDALREVLGEGDQYGRSNAGGGKKVLLEFVSANPTGPIIVVQARAGAVGDTLANLFDWAGFSVAREFYVNDAGNQVATLGRSLEMRYRQLLGENVEVPEECYPGEYLIDVARKLMAEKGSGLLSLPEDERQGLFSSYAVSRIREMQQESLERYGVEFDVWFSEKGLHDAGDVGKVVEFLRGRGYAYDQDGAVWLKSTAFGDDKDRVLVKSDGAFTYLAPDIAYHLNKYRRGYELLIDIWGPDHHGYIPRMKAAVEALGYPRDSFEVLIVQLVRLIKQGEPVKMSKRMGEFVTMDELLDDVGKDVARFFFLLRSPDAHLDFDLDLAKIQSNENPVYYVQYAHARISSIFREAAARGFTGLGVEDLLSADLSPLTDESEVALVKKLAEFPGEIASSAVAREPHRMPRYLAEVATAFHSFYTRCRVLGVDEPAMKARLALSFATQTVLRNGLSLLRVDAPDRM